MNGFFPRQQQQQQQQQQQYGGDDMQSINTRGNGSHLMGMAPPDTMASAAVIRAASFDGLLGQHDKSLRRASLPMAYGGTPGLDVSLRRASMMEFTGSSPSGPLDSFQFDPSAATAFDTTMTTDLPAQINGVPRARRASHVGLSVNTQLPSQNFYSPMGPPGSAYASPMHMNGSLDIDLNSPYATAGLPLSMDLNMMGNELSAVDMFAGPDFESPMVGSPMHTTFAGSMMGPTQDPGGGVLDQPKAPLPNSAENSVAPDFRSSTSRTSSHQGGVRPSSRRTSASAGAQPSQMPSMPPQLPPPITAGPFSRQASAPSAGGPEMIAGNVLPWSTPDGGWPSTMYNRPHMETTQFKDAYAPSGFDLLTILMRVATRPNPQINIGAVDLSCAFVVTDAKERDNPIVYCSESFERLTGYSRHEIQQRNCRFLQSPDGKVEAGVKRKYCDDDAVLYLKNAINTRAEAQISLINYRKGGQPFMNLLTMIPVFDESGDVSNFVGFQVDLVERPQAINSKNPDGTYSVNYQRQADLPGYYLHTPETSLLAEYSQTVPRDEVSAVLTTMNSGESELSKRIMDKVLLENSDDIIHVLSLKGLFLYLSPACRRVLEYEPSELVGTALSSVCHPSDIVPVTRELKDTSSSTSVSVVFRIRRKRSGYMWFESHGSLHTEQGKGRKCIILIGRERPVYTLSKRDIYNAGGIGEHELWTKMSTTGMYLFVSSNVRSLLDRQPEELVGTNIQAMMRPDSKQEFARTLTIALAGKSCSVKHEMTNRKGQVIQAFSWIFPGDAVEGQKPTFLVVQTRLIKYHRGQGPQRPGTLVKQEHNSATSVQSAASSASINATVDASPLALSGPSSQIENSYPSTSGYPISHAGQNGLAIGRQDASLASEDNVFDELKTTRSTSWQYELRQMEKRNRILAEEVQSLMSAKKKRKRRRGAGMLQKDCANCHTKHTPEWRRGPSGNRDLCNSCGLRWAKQNGRVSPRTSSRHSVQSDKASKASASPDSDQATGSIPLSMNLNAGIENQTPSAAAPMVQTAVASIATSPTTAETFKKSTSPQQTQHNLDSHAAKMARMEVSAMAAQGLAGGVPPKIEEGIEPD